MVTFNDVPSSTLVPFVYVEIDPSKAQQGPSIQEYRGLVIGQRLTAGTIAQNVPTLLTSADAVGKAFGFGSMIHAMAIAWFRANRATETWFVGIDDAGGAVAATKTLTVTGPATESGTIFLYIAGRRITLSVLSGDAQNAIASAIATAIAASPFAAELPVTAGAATNVVTLTARNGGTQGNAIDVRLNFQTGEKLPAGVAIAIAAGATGITDPTVTNALAALGPKQFHVLALGLNDSTNIGLVDAELSERYLPSVQLAGSALYGKVDTFGNLVTAANALNSKHTSLVGLRGPLSPPWELAASAAAVVARFGQEDPGRPFKTLELPGMVGPVAIDRFTLEERDLLLKAGISTVLTDDLGVTRIERLVTTYKTNASGAQDLSFKDLTTLLILEFLRFDFRTQFSSAYPRHKLARDGTRFGPGQPIVTPSSAKGFALSIFRGWEFRGLVEDVDQFKRDLVVEISATDGNRLDFLLPPNLINQLQVVGAQIQFLS